MTGTSVPAFVAVDWGTSSFRAWLMAADATPLAETRSGEGMQHCAGSGFEHCCGRTSRAWPLRTVCLS